jgi:hypothetical protein
LIVFAVLALVTHAHDASVFSLFKKQKAPSPTYIDISDRSLQYSAMTNSSVDTEFSIWNTYTNNLFKKCDANKSGNIDKAEYVACSGKKDPLWYQLINQFDANKDYLINWQEAFNASKTFDKHFISLTMNDLSSNKKSSNS